jgi:mRNA interferase MazF
MAEPERDEIWLVKVPDRPARPYLVLTRDEAIPVLRRIVAAPLTRTIRGIPTELPLGPDEGLAIGCVASFDNIETVPKTGFTRRIGAVGANRRHEVCRTLANVVDC